VAAPVPPAQWEVEKSDWTVDHEYFFLRALFLSRRLPPGFKTYTALWQEREHSNIHKEISKQPRIIPQWR